MTSKPSSWARLGLRKPLTKTMLGVLRWAAARPDGCVCPTSLRGAAEEAVLRPLRQRGLITDEPAPRITEEGRRAVRNAV